MEIGIKIFPEDLRYAQKIAKYCDFFEVMAVPGSDFQSLRSVGKPFTVHTIHSHWGFNPANPEKAKLNSVAVKAAAKAAVILKADTIVVHPGLIESGACSLARAIDFISVLDSRFIVENMPASFSGFPHIGCDIDDLARLTRHNRRICLDFPHAAEYAHACGVDCKRFVKSIIERFNPGYFHISDTRIQDRADLHLHLKEGDLKFWYFERLVPKRGRLLIETAHDFMKQHRDIMLLRQNR